MTSRQHAERTQADQSAQAPIALPKVSQPASRALAGAGYTHLEQLTTVSATEIARLHGMGPRGITILRAALAAHGLAFAGE